MAEKVGEKIAMSHNTQIEAGKNSSQSIKDIQKTLSELPHIGEFTTEVNYKKQYHIIHVPTGMKLPFVLQGPKEAADMKLLLAKAMVIQDTCIEKKKLIDTCKIYSEQSVLWDYNLYVDDNPYIIGPDSLVFSGYKIESVLRWENNKNSMTEGVNYFVEGMANYINKIQEKKNQVVQK